MTFLQWHLLSLKLAGTGYDASSSSTINQLVCGLMENPHFLDVLERTSRRIDSPQMTSQPAASCSTSSSRPFQTPVEEFRSLLSTGTGSSTSIPRFRTRRPVGMSLSQLPFLHFFRALFSRLLGHAHIFSLEPLDGQRGVLTYIYMLRITYTYVMCLNVINVHNVFAR